MTTVLVPRDRATPGWRRRRPPGQPPPVELPDGDAEIVWITHRCLEANFRSALDVISRLEIVTGIQNWSRVEE